MYRIPEMRTISQLTSRISELTSIDETIVNEVIRHHYKNLKEKLSNPNFAYIQYEYFGKFIVKLPAVKKYILTFALPNYRKNRSPENRDHLLKFLSLYREVKKYKKNKSFKKRFGT